MKTFLLSLFSLLFVATYSQIGSLDSTFGNNGILVLPAGQTLTAPDGSYYSIQRKADPVTGISWVTVAKYSRNGTLDLTFGPGGYTRFIGVESFIAKVQDDGKLVIAGNTPSDAPWEILPGEPAEWDHYVDRIVFRFTTGGLLDSTFTSSGYITSSVGRATFDFTRSLQVGNGRIAVVGYGVSLPGNFVVFDLVEYYGMGNLPLTPLLSPLSDYNTDEFQYHVFFQGNKTLIASQVPSEGTILPPTISRYNPDKTLDSTFGVNGVINDFTSLLTIQGDNIVIPSVYVDPSSGKRSFTLRRYNNEGVPDSQFNATANQQALLYPAANSLVVNAILTQGDKIIVGGTITDPQTGKTGFIVARYNQDGTLDQTFNSYGIVTSYHADNLQLRTMTIVGNRLSVTGGNIVALYILDEEQNFTCPTDTSLSTAPGTCSTVVNGLDPVGSDSLSSSIRYSLSGATIATGTGTASGLSFNKGVTTVTYSAGSGDSNTCTFKVTVLDKEPPAIFNVHVTPANIWPPNKRMVDVYLDYKVSDNCGWTAVELSIDANEDESGKLKPHKQAEWVIVDDHHVQLKAIKGKHGYGGIYMITITATDAAGNQRTQTVAIPVAKDPLNTKDVYTSAGKPALTAPGDGGLQVTAFPNPSPNQFFVVLSSNSNEPIQMRVINNLGNVLETRTGLRTNSRVQVGANYQRGIYLAEFIQGNTRQVLRIIKE